MDTLRTLPAQMLAKLPADQRNDPQVQQEVARVALESLASSAIDALGSDGDHPVFLPMVGEVLNIGQPNADTVYRLARITPGGVYRLRGRLGSDVIAKIGESGPSLGDAGVAPSHVGMPFATHDLSTLHLDPTGHYDVILSPQRPAGYTGDWWPLNPAATKLGIRMVSSDWARQQDPTLSIERLDAPVTRPRPSAADLEARLRRAPFTTSAMALLFMDHVGTLVSTGYVNRLEVFDLSKLGGGLVGQFYYEGAYQLKDDEALIVEAKVPTGCIYHSMILTNGLYETTDWYNNQSSLNGSQAQPDKDGVLRIVVSAKDPGVPNWMDTAGYPLGVVQGRWTSCDSNPIPSVQKVALADVRKALPPETPSITPQQREQIIRDRRSAVQQRPLW